MKNVVLKSLLLGTALTVASSNFAFAEGWTGFRIGAGGGANYGTTDLQSIGLGTDDNELEFGFAGTGSADGQISNEEIDALEQGFGAAIFGSTEDGNDADSDPDGISVIYDFLTQTAFNIVGKSEMGDVGSLGVAEIGYDVAMSPMVVVGVTADYGFGKTELNHDSIGATVGYEAELVNQNYLDEAYGAGLTSLSNKLELGSNWSVGGRMGFNPTEGTLIFATGGYTQVKSTLTAEFIGGSFVDNDINGNGTLWDVEASNTQWLDGYYVGGGMETMLSSNLSMKVEYRYTDLESMVVEGVDDDESVVNAGVASEVDPNIHSVRATIGIRF